LDPSETQAGHRTHSDGMQSNLALQISGAERSGQDHKPHAACDKGIRDRGSDLAPRIEHAPDKFL
jgi:hypothetical protein